MSRFIEWVRQYTPWKRPPRTLAQIRMDEMTAEMLKVFERSLTFTSQINTEWQPWPTGSKPGQIIHIKRPNRYV